LYSLPYAAAEKTFAHADRYYKKRDKSRQPKNAANLSIIEALIALASNESRRLQCA